MKKALVTFYSRTGTTRRVAYEIAEELDADLDEIVSVQNHKGVSGYLLSAFESLTKGSPIIQTTRSPSDYSLVIVGTPVWMGSISSPIRTYLSIHTRDFHSVACFCTMRRRGAEPALQEMLALCGGRDRPTFGATASHVQEGAHRRELAAFCARLRQSQDQHASHAA